MALLYRVCQGNTTITLLLTLSKVGSCGDCDSWYADYYNNERCYQRYRITLDQPSPVAFDVNFNVAYTVELNNAPYASGYYLDIITVPAGVLTYDFVRECSSSIVGSVGDNPTGFPEQAV